MQKNKILALLLLATMLVVTLTACGMLPNAEATEEAPVIVIDKSVVSSTGILVPEKFAYLSIPGTGIVDEVYVYEEQLVAKDQKLISLGGLGQAEAALAAAEFEYEAAQQALQDLIENADLARAFAQQALDDAEQALEDLQGTGVQLKISQAHQVVANAEEELDDAVEDREKKDYQRATDLTIDEAKSNYLLAEDVFEDAEEDFKEHEHKSEEDLIRAHFLTVLANAKRARDNALANWNWMLGRPDEIEILLADVRIEVAEANLVEAKKEYDEALEGPDPDDIAVLEAQIDTAERDVQALKDGPDPDQLALAEARLNNAAAQIAAAEDQIDNLTLKSPFAGTIAELMIRIGEWTTPAQPIVVLADLDSLRIETTDLNELDVVQIEVGDKVEVAFDAIPDVIFEGAVIEISPKASEGTGVNYTVVIDLAMIPQEARWGMTVFIDIDTKQ